MITELKLIHNKSCTVVYNETFENPALARKKEQYLRLKYHITKKDWRPWYTLYVNTTNW